MRRTTIRLKFFIVSIVSAIPLGNQSAFAQASVSIYGGYSSQDGPSVIGHSLTASSDVLLDINGAGFGGISYRSAPLQTGPFRQFEFYFEGVSGDRQQQAGPAGFAMVSVNGSTRTTTGIDAIARDSLKGSRYEIGNRLFFPGSTDSLNFFVTPFAGWGDGRLTTTLTNPLGLLAQRSAAIDFWYAGLDLGSTREFRLGERFTFIAAGSAGAYWIDADGTFTFQSPFFPATNRSFANDRERFGFRASAKVELNYQWTQVLSSSVFAQATYWSDLPYASMPSNAAGVHPPAHTSFSDLAEYQIGVIHRGTRRTVAASIGFP